MRKITGSIINEMKKNISKKGLITIGISLFTVMAFVTINNACTSSNGSGNSSDGVAMNDQALGETGKCSLTQVEECELDACYGKDQAGCTDPACEFDLEDAECEAIDDDACEDLTGDACAASPICMVVCEACDADELECEAVDATLEAACEVATDALACAGITNCAWNDAEKECETVCDDLPEAACNATEGVCQWMCEADEEEDDEDGDMD